MRSKGNAPTAAQQRWRTDIAELGCIITNGPAEIDHAVGGTAKHEGIHIGEWWLITLNPGIHRLWQANRTSGRYLLIDEYCAPEFREIYKGLEKQWFWAVCCRYRSYYRRELPFDYEVLNAIMGYSR